MRLCQPCILAQARAFEVKIAPLSAVATQHHCHIPSLARAQACLWAAAICHMPDASAALLLQLASAARLGAPAWPRPMSGPSCPPSVPGESTFNVTPWREPSACYGTVVHNTVRSVQYEINLCSSVHDAEHTLTRGFCSLRHAERTRNFLPQSSSSPPDT